MVAVYSNYTTWKFQNQLVNTVESLEHLVCYYPQDVDPNKAAVIMWRAPNTPNIPKGEIGNTKHYSGWDNALMRRLQLLIYRNNVLLTEICF